MPFPRLALLLAPAFCGALAFSPATAEVFRPQTFTLDNGLEVILVENDRVPAVTQMLWYKVGAADEPRHVSGIAHFLEHLMFKGTETVEPGVFSATVSRMGGRENAFTSQDSTAYFQTVAREDLGTILRLEADRMTALTFDEAQVTAERDVILEERRARVDNNPGAQLSEAVMAALHPNHPYGTPIIGWAHEMAALDRDDALDFYRTWYAPNNAVLAIAGDITLDELKPMVEMTYGQIPARDVPARERLLDPPALGVSRVELTSAEVSSPRWQRVYKAPSHGFGESTHALSLSVLADILGGDTGRLYRRLVREEGVATSVYAWYDPWSLDYGTFGFGLSPRPGTDLDAAAAILEEELATVIRDGVTAEEVDEAITKMRRSAIFARDDLDAGARLLGRTRALGLDLATVEEWPERLAAVTPDSIQRAAEHVLRLKGSVTGILLPEAPPS